MAVSETLTQAPCGTVEVSGWDGEEVFFVEKARLDWNESAGKHNLLAHMLAEHAIIFARTLEQPASQRSTSSAYEAELVSCDSPGFHWFLLNAVQPRFSRTSLYRCLKRDGFENHPHAHSTGAAA